MSRTNFSSLFVTSDTDKDILVARDCIKMKLPCPVPPVFRKFLHSKDFLRAIKLSRKYIQSFMAYKKEEELTNDKAGLERIKRTYIAAIKRESSGTTYIDTKETLYQELKNAELRLGQCYCMIIQKYNSKLKIASERAFYENFYFSIGSYFRDAVVQSEWPEVCGQLQKLFFVNKVDLEQGSAITNGTMESINVNMHIQRKIIERKPQISRIGLMEIIQRAKDRNVIEDRRLKEKLTKWELEKSTIQKEKFALSAVLNSRSLLVSKFKPTKRDLNEKLLQEYRESVFAKPVHKITKPPKNQNEGIYSRHFREFKKTIKPESSSEEQQKHYYAELNTEKEIHESNEVSGAARVAAMKISMHTDEEIERLEQLSLNKIISE